MYPTNQKPINHRPNAHATNEPTIDQPRDWGMLHTCSNVWAASSAVLRKFSGTMTKCKYAARRLLVFIRWKCLSPTKSGTTFRRAKPDCRRHHSAWLCPCTTRRFIHTRAVHSLGRMPLLTQPIRFVWKRTTLKCRPPWVAWCDLARSHGWELQSKTNASLWRTVGAVTLNTSYAHQEEHRCLHTHRSHQQGEKLTYFCRKCEGLSLVGLWHNYFIAHTSCSAHHAVCTRMWTGLLAGCMSANAVPLLADARRNSCGFYRSERAAGYEVGLGLVMGSASCQLTLFLSTQGACHYGGHRSSFFDNDAGDAVRLFSFRHSSILLRSYEYYF